MNMADPARAADTVLETRHLRLVQAIADAGGVTRAGDRLHLTQSAVSRQLTELELAIVHAEVRRRELDVEPLFDDEVVAVVAPGHRFAARRFLEGRDLDGETLLAFGSAGPDALWFRKTFLGRAVPREVRAVPIT